MLYNMPRTIEDVFCDAANKSTNDIHVKWHNILVSCGLIDIDRSTKNNTVCVKPHSNYQYDDLNQTVDWLRPYNNVDPLVATVIHKMDIVLVEWKNST